MRFEICMRVLAQHYRGDIKSSIARLATFVLILGDQASRVRRDSAYVISDKDLAEGQCHNPRSTPLQAATRLS